MQEVGTLNLDNLRRLGLGRIVDCAGLETPELGALASYGRSRLAYPGADSYMGHQEIMGTIPELPVMTLMSQAADLLQARLVSAGHAVEKPLDGTGLLIVDDAIVIGDNLEADPGLIINLTVATDSIGFEDALKVGQIVRDLVRVSRVIVFGGPGVHVTRIMRHVKVLGNGQVGVDSPSLGVYNTHLQVRHLGYGIDPERQAPSILARSGVQIVLIGKMADLILCPSAIRDPAVSTLRVMKSILEFHHENRNALIAATVQETDLAAHGGDAFRLARVLEQTDRGLGALLPEIAEGDALIICADHGNDLKVNVGLHTREETPLLVYQKGRPSLALGVRKTLADIGATITHLFNAPKTRDGSIIGFRRRV
jgi:phosphopentomutase